MSLQLQRLCDPTRIKTVEGVKDNLKRLPETLSDLYSVTYQSITECDDYSRILAENVISWILCSETSLPSKEIRYMASSHMDDTASTNHILDICSNLISLDTDSDTFVFAHLSVREFFEGHPDFEATKINASVVNRCMSLLVRERENKLEAGEDIQLEASFSCYAMVYWASHYVKIDHDHRVDSCGQAMTLLLAKPIINEPSLFERWSKQMRMWGGLKHSNVMFPKVGPCSISTPTVEHFIAAHGALELLESLDEAQGLDWGCVEGEYCPWPPIHVAARFGQLEVIRMLAKKERAYCEAKDDSGKTPLIFAAGYGHLEVVQQLCTYGVDVNHQDSQGEAALLVGARNGEEEVCVCLLSHGALTESSDEFGETPLSRAARYGYIDIVKSLQSYGADLEHTNRGGETPLMLAVQGHSTGMINFLTKQKVNLEAKDRYGKTALSVAVHSQNTAAVRLLLEHGANPDDVTQVVPMLVKAVFSGALEIAVELIKHSAFVDVQDGRGQTSLMYAAKAGNETLVAMLVNYGASIDMKDHEGRTALLFAKRKGHAAVVDMLSKAEASQRGGAVEPKARFHEVVDAPDKGLNVLSEGLESTELA